MRSRRGQRKLFGMVHLKDTEILFAFDLHRRRCFGLWIAFALATACKNQSQKEKLGHRFDARESHWMTSRPAARFNCFAAPKYEATRFKQLTFTVPYSA